MVQRQGWLWMSAQFSAKDVEIKANKHVDMS